VTVVVVGGGPAGLAAALELRRRATRDVVVVEREAEAGGIPRHARHQGFGLRDLRRPLSGPAYAARYARRAEEAGIEIRTETMVTRWTPDGPLQLTAPDGPELIEADAVILATGCRERPRSARLVPGSRPEGVMNTGTLQQLVYLKELLGAAHARPRGREGRRDDDRAATPPDRPALPRGRGAPLAHAALDTHAGDGDPRASAR
jgi:cation diffusion facilitator CzcD-associated flavoprotein CzcO